MMKTILYLGNTYCSNIAELRDIIKKSPAQDSLLGKELLCALKDGTLARWLSEGEEEEQSLVKKLPQIQSDSSDSDLLKKLGECLKSDYKIHTFQISDFFVLKEVCCRIGDRPTSNIPLKGVNIVCPNDDVVKMFFHFTFSVDRTIGENVKFYLRIRRNQETLECSETKEINLRELNKSLEIDFSVNNKGNLDAVIELVSLFMGYEMVVWNSSILTETARVIKVGNVSFKMIYVAGGTFNMGEGIHREEPVHKVTLDSFFIAETQVTQELWESVMGDNPSHFKGKQNPVEYVSWDDCKSFIEKINKMTGLRFRLPTEAEWEYAAKGGNKSKGYSEYSGDNDIETVAWFSGNSNNTTHPVKQLKPNELGIYDMCGNVWEWCEDGYSEYFISHKTNPIVNKKNYSKVIRGGAYYLPKENCFLFQRSCMPKGFDGCLIGFRLALDMDSILHNTNYLYVE
mgnify:CR=1 FL=1